MPSQALILNPKRIPSYSHNRKAALESKAKQSCPKISGAHSGKLDPMWRLSKSVEALGIGLARARPYVQRPTTDRGGWPGDGPAHRCDGRDRGPGRRSSGLLLRTMTSHCPPHPRWSSWDRCWTNTHRDWSSGRAPSTATGDSYKDFVY